MAVLMLACITIFALGQSHGTPEDEAAVKATIEDQRGEFMNGSATHYAADADWTNAFGQRLHSREEIARKFDALRHDPNFMAGRKGPKPPLQMDVRFVRPDVAVVHVITERSGQIDPTTGKVMPTDKVHTQYVLSKEGDKWVIQACLIMDEKHFEKETK